MQALISRVLTIVTSFARRFLCHLPGKLPIGMTAFEKWAKSILKAYDLPENDSTWFALATIILHAEPKNFYKPKAFWARTLLKGASNQVASFIVQEMKGKQQKRTEEEAKKKQAEVTATAPAVTSEPVQDETVPCAEA